jgi:hypothetical protein
VVRRWKMMGYRKGILMLAMCSILLAGCGKEDSTDEERVRANLKDNEYLEALGSTPKNSIPSSYKGKGDTIIPCNAWRTFGTHAGDEPEVEYDVSVTPGEADIPISITWPDTMVVVYTDLPDVTIRDTIYKPVPTFQGDVKFFYEIVDGEWEFCGMTPGKIESESAGDYVKIDSVQIKRNGTALPSIITADQYMAVADYPYIFSVGDSIKVTVYKSGSLPDSLAWVFLHAPLKDWVDVFDYVSPGVWEGTWVPKVTQAHWAWVNVFDMGVVKYKTQMAERDVLWGLPYKVQ